ncbi:MAG: thiamine phosphate synthase [Clostridia bacterium]|nr:thiamine phosphate synthase [Lachnospiraceae bacterium]NCB99199.1 thiamine phosphate synthase [Clostridia bacterium]NCD03371.1 thiamine phosphate synthase [Clostridia bacterium]
MNKKLLQLYAVTDRQWLKPGETLASAVEAAIKGGVTLVQLREKHMDDKDFINEALEVKRVTDAYNIPLIINDNLNVCQACDAAGIHIGQDDMSVIEVRRILGPDKIIGVTAKTVEQAETAVKGGADYLGSGAMFGSSTKSEAKPMTLKEFQYIRQAVDVPIVLIGGIDAENIHELKNSGAQGAAVVSGIFAKADVKKAAEELKTLSLKIFPD